MGKMFLQMCCIYCYAARKNEGEVMEMKVVMSETNYRKYKDCLSVLGEVRRKVISKDSFSIVSGLSKTKIKKIERITGIPTEGEFRVYCLTLMAFHLVKNDIMTTQNIS